jgi:hypothetical protein
MATKRETNIVYGAGVTQGIVLVTFPAASTIFTDPDEYGLSNTQCGFLFVLQVVTAKPLTSTEPARDAAPASSPA